MDEQSLKIEIAPAAGRYCLRTRVAQSVSAALGLELPTRIGSSAEADAGTALCLGPDEWLILAGDAMLPTVDAPHSLVDISERDIVVELSGSDVLDALATGCPRDLRGLPVGGGLRTVFDGVSIVLHRRGHDRFDVHVWRSYAPHIIHHLETVQRELALGL